MNRKGTTTAWKTDFGELVRNRYYYGKMMDVYSFELETEYFLAVQRLLNRLITGYGVICGLDVRKVEKENCIVITRGAAVDRWGRLIVVPEPSRALAIPEHVLPGEKISEEIQKKQEKMNQDECQTSEEYFIHVVLCYHECDSDPSPVLSSDCESWGTCEAGAIRERYRVEFRHGKAERPVIGEGRFPDVISEGRLNYRKLATWVTEGCANLNDDSCIPLANICLSLEEDKYVFTQEGIDITVRPIVYSNDLLFDMLIASMTEDTSYRRGK